MRKIICPVCGVENAVKKLPWDEGGFPSQDICPCCGTHYGEDDWADTAEKRKKLFRVLREKWMSGGMKWWAEIGGELDIRKPNEWNPNDQLKSIPPEFL